MSNTAVRSETVDLLQELGLKEYEARCFLALTRIREGTAKEVSDISEVPRTRVYDATRVLEAKGLVEVQHSNPQQFRAVSISEATATLHQQYENHIDTLRSCLENLGPPPETSDSERLQEVWSLSGHEAIGARVGKLIEDADSEIMFIVVDDDILTDALFRKLRAANDRGATVAIGGMTESVQNELHRGIPEARIFESELTWLTGETDDVGIGRVLLTDRSKLLISSFHPGTHEERETEQAIFATGLRNGVIVLIRRMLSSGLLPIPGHGD